MANNIWTGATTDWGLNTNWSLGTVPTASDGHTCVFNAASPACSLGSSNKVCNGIDFTGYTNTLAFSVRTLSVSGNVVLDPGMTWTGTGVFTMAASGSITSNGFVSPAGLTFGFTGSAQTYTLQDDLNILGSCSLNGSSVSLTINNNGTSKIIYAGGNVSSSAAGSQGTAKIVMNGTGTWNSTGAVQNDLEINTAGTITFGTNVRFATGTFLYTAGTVVTTGSTFNLGLSGSATTTFNAAGISLNTVVFIGGAGSTITLASDLNATGTVSASSTVTVNGNNININGSGTYGVGGGGSGIVQGTATVQFLGASCGWVSGTGTNRLNININTAGTLTCSGTTINSLNTITYIAGTVVTTGHTLNLSATVTLDTDPVVWNSVTFNTSTTHTLASDLYIAGTFTSNGGTSLNGNTLHLTGNMILGGSQILQGTTILSLMAGGTWTSGSGILRLNTNIAAGAGSFTLIGSTINYNTGTMTYVSGTLVTTGSTLVTSTAIFNTFGAVFDNVSISAGTVTLNSSFDANMLTLGTGSNVTFNGTSGFNVVNLVCVTANRAIVLKAGNTYNVTGSVVLKGTGTPSSSTNSVTLQSDTVSSAAFFTVSPTAICNCTFARAIDIDSSGGRQMYTVKGLISRTTNWLRTVPDYYNLF